MVDAVYVIDKASGIPLYHKSFFSDNSIEEMLLSGFITAMTNFGNDIHIGNISSFDTEKNRCVMVSSDKRLLAVLYDPTKEGGLDVHSLAGYLIDEFEKKYPSQTEPMGVERLNTEAFDSTVETMLSKKQKPFYYKALEWSKKEFGGDLYIRQKQFNNEEQPIIIDIVLDRGEVKNPGILDKITKRLTGDDFSKDMVYIKVIDGQVGSGEAKEFFNVCQTFGRRRSNDVIPSYFPSLAVIIAKAYSPTFDRIFSNYIKKGDKYILVPEAAPRIAKMINKPPKTHRCYIQCWKWSGEYPELLYE